MRLVVDTNVLVRAVVQDDARQAEIAARTMREAETIAVSGTCLCEFVWVLGRLYKLARDDIAAAVDRLSDTANVVMDRPSVAAGLAILRAGGDFADGLIAYEGAWSGGDTFASFDKKAVSLVAKQGMKTIWLGA